MDFMLISTFCSLCFIVLTAHIFTKQEEKRIESEREMRNKFFEIIADNSKKLGK